MYIRDTGESYINDPRQSRMFNRLNENAEYEDEQGLLLNEDAGNFDETDYGEITDQEALIEAFLIDEISRMNDEERNAFFNSDAYQALYEAGFIKRNVVKLTKNSDLARRTMIAVLNKARELGDPLWTRLSKNRIEEKKLLTQLHNKYANSVNISVKKAQDSFVKLHKATNFNKEFNNITNIR